MNIHKCAKQLQFQVRSQFRTDQEKFAEEWERSIRSMLECSRVGGGRLAALALGAYRKYAHLTVIANAGPMVARTLSKRAGVPDASASTQLDKLDSLLSSAPSARAMATPIRSAAASVSRSPM